MRMNSSSSAGLTKARPNFDALRKAWAYHASHNGSKNMNSAQWYKRYSHINSNGDRYHLDGMGSKEYGFVTGTGKNLMGQNHYGIHWPR